MAANRSAARNVHIYDARDLNNVLGGLVLTNGVTNDNFYQMIDILFLFNSEFFLRNEGGVAIQRDRHPLEPGNYYLVASAPFSQNNEQWLARSVTIASGTRQQAFRDNVRARDSRCPITKRVAVGAAHGNWSGLEAAHIFPLAHEGHWIQLGYGRWITIPSPTGSAINSVQNGMLLRADMHGLFNNYFISINPDDDYKIVCFDQDADGVAGERLDQRLLDSPSRPVDQILRWHYRQAVLANMRGAGEPIFESDFPPGSDIAGEIRRGPKAAERMEFELFSRLAGFVHGES